MAAEITIGYEANRHSWIHNHMTGQRGLRITRNSQRAVRALALESSAEPRIEYYGKQPLMGRTTVAGTDTILSSAASVKHAYNMGINRGDMAYQGPDATSARHLRS